MTGPEDRANPRFDRDLALGLGVPRAAAQRLPGTPDTSGAARAFALVTVTQWRTPVTASALTEAVDDLVRDLERERAWLCLVESPDALLLVLTKVPYSPPAGAPAEDAQAIRKTPPAREAAERWIRIPFPDRPPTPTASR
ncbi:hypothetical protein ACIQOV_20930 [Kitasatospora sp. NPDC091257]|uniref:hypothetical protein n=1 Tax=Kitasatospora sp. NPDC091257 TaxID=3364084 RepID=UPI003814527A